MMPQEVRTVFTTFSRTTNPLVSVLIPTRGRSQLLCEAIDSIYSLTSNKQNVEFLLKIDNDDEETIETAQRLSFILPLQAWVTDRGAGYADMHLWVNELCARARGDWLFLFNDDARMRTPNWDKMLENVSIPASYGSKVHDVYMFIVNVIGKKDATEFGFLRRKVYEILGHYSLSPHNDTWICTVMGLIRCLFRLPIDIEHLDNTIKDVVRDEVQEAYINTRHTLDSEVSIRDRIKDATKLLDHLCPQNEELSLITSLPFLPRPVAHFEPVS